MKEKKIATKNYIILTVLILGTLLACLYLFTWYKQYHETKLQTPVITEVVSEVKLDNLNTVLQERDFLILYMCTSSQTVCRTFEEKLGDYIKQEELVDDFVYLNLGYNSDEKNYITTIYNRYKHEDLVKKVYRYPSIFIFKDGKIVDLLSSNKKNISMTKVKEFLEGYDI